MDEPHSELVSGRIECADPWRHNLDPCASTKGKEKKRSATKAYHGLCNGFVSSRSSSPATVLAMVALYFYFAPLTNPFTPWLLMRVIAAFNWNGKVEFLVIPEFIAWNSSRSKPSSKDPWFDLPRPYVYLSTAWSQIDNGSIYRFVGGRCCQDSSFPDLRETKSWRRPQKLQSHGRSDPGSARFDH